MGLTEEQGRRFDTMFTKLNENETRQVKMEADIAALTSAIAALTAKLDASVPAANAHEHTVSGVAR